MKSHQKNVLGTRGQRLLQNLNEARGAGHRSLNDLHRYVRAKHLEAKQSGPPISRSALYRAIKVFQQQGLDVGLDDRSTARKLGQPTRSKGGAMGTVAQTRLETNNDAGRHTGRHSSADGVDPVY